MYWNCVSVGTAERELTVAVPLVALGSGQTCFGVRGTNLFWRLAVLCRPAAIYRFRRELPVGQRKELKFCEC